MSHQNPLPTQSSGVAAWIRARFDRSSLGVGGGKRPTRGRLLPGQRDRRGSERRRALVLHDLDGPLPALLRGVRHPRDADPAGPPLAAPTPLGTHQGAGCAIPAPARCNDGSCLRRDPCRCHGRRGSDQSKMTSRLPPPAARRLHHSNASRTEAPRIVVRPAQEADASAIAGLWTDGFVGEQGVSRPPWSKSDVRAAAATGDVLIAEHRERVIGAVALVPHGADLASITLARKSRRSSGCQPSNRAVDLASGRP
jgi:hypothetical protein